jgi:uncharacterized protein (UPF0261 family)
MKELVAAKEIPKCPACGGLVKPDIVFFGEALPENFWLRRYYMHNTGTSILVPRRRHLGSISAIFPSVLSFSSVPSSRPSLGDTDF